MSMVASVGKLSLLLPVGTCQDDRIGEDEWERRQRELLFEG